MRTVWIWLLGNLICVSAHADLIQFANFSDVSEFTLNSDAAVQNPNSDDVLRVSGTENSVGTAFITNLVDFGLDGSFLTHFSFQISDDGFDSEADIGGADGMAFVIQSTSNEAVGRSGGGIGYQFIENSLAVEFDTWFNLESDRNDIDGNHVGIALNGDASNEIAQASGADPLDTGNIFHTWIEYDGSTDLLSVFLSAVYIQPVIPTLTVSIDLLAELGQSEAYVGFTGVSGAQSRGLYQQNDILSWELRTGANLTSVPEPSTLGLLGAGLLGLFVQRKRVGSRGSHI